MPQMLAKLLRIIVERFGQTPEPHPTATLKYADELHYHTRVLHGRDVLLAELREADIHPNVFSEFEMAELDDTARILHELRLSMMERLDHFAERWEREVAPLLAHNLSML